MNFLNGITNLTNWMGNVIMPTLAALFFALGVLRYARAGAHLRTVGRLSLPDGLGRIARHREIRGSGCME
jgi:hypothetical protein